MKICYRPKNFRAATLVRIEEINDIIDEYDAQGFSLTLRQLYYQFVARGVIPNDQKEYDKLGAILNDGRLAGLIDWDSIEDRTRNLKDHAHWSSPAGLIRACAQQFTLDLWEDQEYAIEVWIEKEALIGVIEPICNELQIPFFACRGYVSQSEQWNAGRRILRRYDLNNQQTVIIHLGDHDPSGIDMTRDNDERLNMFSEQSAIIKRVALNMDQVKLYNPPPNPAKSSDSRFTDYKNRYGYSSWELDALEPRVIAALIRDTAALYTDEEGMQTRRRKTHEGRARLRTLADAMDAEDYAS